MDTELIDSRPFPASPALDAMGRPISPLRTLGLLSLAHAFNHAQTALLPFVFLVIIEQFRVGVSDIAFLMSAATLLAGSMQLSYSWLTRYVSRAALAHGRLRDTLRVVLADRDLRLVFVSSMLGGGARGLGILHLFVPLYLALVLKLPTGTVALMLTVLLAGSVPGPLVAGWLSDRLGRRPLIVAVYLGGAISIALFVLAGSNEALLWTAVVLMSAFSFVESPQLQSLLADISRPAVRDASFAVYFTLAFGVGALWTALYGAVVGAMGEMAGLPVVFWLMVAAYLVAAAVVLPIRAEERTRQVRAEEEALLRYGRAGRPGT